MPHLLAGPSTLICVHQGVSPFGNTQSRCHIFWLVHLLSFVFTKVSHLLVTPSQDAHLLAGPSILICVHQGVSPFGNTQSRCHIFWLVHPLSFVFTKVSHLLAIPSQDATSFGWSIHSHLCSPRCLTFWQHPVKMPHFWLVHPFHLCSSRCPTF